MDVSPSEPDVSKAPQYLIPCGILAAIAAGLCITRIWTRLRPSPRMTLDDYLIAIAGVLSLTGYCAISAAAAYGWGRQSAYVATGDRENALKCLFAVQLCWIFGVGLVRVSVACTLLRFCDLKLWNWTLYVAIVLQCLIACGSIILVLFACRPIRVNWEFVAVFSCWDLKYTYVYGWVCAVIFIITDLLLALMPLKFIWNLHRPLTERILVCFLMGLGLLATVFAIVKTTTFKSFGHGDSLSSTVYNSMLAKCEEQLGIIAACIPCLKAPAERALRRIGVLSTNIMASLSRPSFVMSQRRRGVHELPVYANNPTPPIPSKTAEESQVELPADPEWKSTPAETVVSNASKRTLDTRSVTTDGNKRQGWEAV